MVLNNKNLFSCGSGGRECKIKWSAESVSPEASALSLFMATFSLGPHAVFPLCAHIPAVSLCIGLPLLIRTPVMLG